MVTCSKCKANLDGDFGVIQCLECGEMNFLDEGPNSVAPALEPELEPEPAVQEVTQSSIQRRERVAGTRSNISIVPNATEVMQEIVDFGNQSTSSSETGILLYEVQIAGIDTLELRRALIEVLKDPKFKWSVDELESKIHNGKLVIQKVTPIKASLLVKKLRPLDLNIYWTQGSVYESNP